MKNNKKYWIDQLEKKADYLTNENHHSAAALYHEIIKIIKEDYFGEEWKDDFIDLFDIVLNHNWN